MENEVVVKENLTAVDIRKQVNLIQEVMKEVMVEGQHYGKIPGCGDKPTLLKPGAEKLSLTFRLRPIIDNAHDISIEKLPDNHLNIQVYCHILNSQGLELATGIGSCSTMESKYRYRGGEKIGTGLPLPTEYWNLKKAGKVSEAQALIGGNEFGPGKINGVWQICETGTKMENPDIADTYNTVLKIAKKRAYIDGILSATAASDFFTQDIEDFPEGTIVTEEKVVTGKPEVKIPQEKPAPAKEEVKKEEPTEQANKPTNPISEAQDRRLHAIAKANGYTPEDITNYLDQTYWLKSSKDIERKDYEAIVLVFQVKKEKNEQVNP